jgi:hypothetical protein
MYTSRKLAASMPKLSKDSKKILQGWLIHLPLYVCISACLGKCGKRSGAILMWFSPAQLNIPRADTVQTASSLIRLLFANMRAFTLLRRMHRCEAVEECATSVLRPIGQSLWAACLTFGEERTGFGSSRRMNQTHAPSKGIELDLCQAILVPQALGTRRLYPPRAIGDRQL